MWKPPEFTGGDLIGYVIRLYYYDGESLVVAVQGNITDPDIRWWVPEGIPDERPLFCQVYKCWIYIAYIKHSILNCIT